MVAGTICEEWSFYYVVVATLHKNKDKEAYIARTAFGGLFVFAFVVLLCAVEWCVGVATYYYQLGVVFLRVVMDIYA